ncbi:inactive hydroxysteroid dehydrogenase-like protein [Dermatophagoides farinae]|uniref:Inactive hydroxysteroid dehydrogenase-like protein n=1 Tax=Dermatophagoides farinae TaxID=6954 RepID=A0A9D4SH70_DERFA|nr:inactive hydroxysteroid dehydrogenase-like protein [Dermatophagoides farinae]
MELLEILGYMMAMILVYKSIVFITGLLLVNYGRKIGLGVKYISDNGEFAVISGATGSIGREFTQEFASMGYNLVLIARNVQKLDRLEQQIRKKYNTMKHVIKIAVDVTKPESYEKLRKQLAEVNPIVVLVNCTSCCPEPEKFWKSSVSKHDLIMINVMAPLIIMDILMPRFVQQNRGIVINVGSQAGDFRFPKYSTFSACKSFMHTLTETVATECNNSNVYVQTVKPCFIANTRNSQPTFFRIPSRLVAYSALMTVGFESSHYGHWKHRLSGLIFNTMIFIFGHRCTTFITGLFLPTYIQTIAGRDHKRTPSSMKIDVTPSPLTPSSPVSSLDAIGSGSSAGNTSEEPSDMSNNKDVLFKLTPPPLMVKSTATKSPQSPKLHNSKTVSNESAEDHHLKNVKMTCKISHPQQPIIVDTQEMKTKNHLPAKTYRSNIDDDNKSQLHNGHPSEIQQDQTIKIKTTKIISTFSSSSATDNVGGGNGFGSEKTITTKTTTTTTRSKHKNLTTLRNLN